MGNCSVQLLVIGTAMVSFQIMHGIFTEYIAQGILSELMWSAAAIELSIYACLAAFELKLRNPQIDQPCTCWPEYYPIALFISLGRGLTWVAYATLSYPTVIVFKSSKILVVMASGLFILRKRFKPAQYFAAIFAVLGLYLVSTADFSVEKDMGTVVDSHMGVAVACLATLLEGTVSNLQERSLKREHRSLAGMLFYTNGLGSMILYCTATINGEMHTFLSEIKRTPIALMWLLATVVLAYGSVFHNHSPNSLI